MTGTRWHHGDCLTPSERAILELWDEGKGSQEIMRRTRYSRARVQDVISNYGQADDARRQRRAAEQGSASLLAAMRRHFPERVAS